MIKRSGVPDIHGLSLRIFFGDSISFTSWSSEYLSATIGSLRWPHSMKRLSLKDRLTRPCLWANRSNLDSYSLRPKTAAASEPPRVFSLGWLQMTVSKSTFLSMSGKKSRTKGHNYEREIARLFREILPDCDAKRGFQTRDGGKCEADVVIPGADELHVECKRGKKVGYRSALKQAVSDSRERRALLPVVIAKDDHCEPVAHMPLEVFQVFLRCWWLVRNSRHKNIILGPEWPTQQTQPKPTQESKDQGP